MTTRGRVYKSYWWETKIITEPAPTETRFLVYLTEPYHKSAHLLTIYYRCNIIEQLNVQGLRKQQGWNIPTTIQGFLHFSIPIEFVILDTGRQY